MFVSVFGYAITRVECCVTCLVDTSEHASRKFCNIVLCLVYCHIRDLIQFLECGIWPQLMSKVVGNMEMVVFPAIRDSIFISS